jgi:predicted Zn-dependent protease
MSESQRLLFAVSDKDEVRAGQQVAANLLGVAPLVGDDGLQRYVNTVGRWIALQGERPELPWRFGVVESADLNAFAGPGGYVLVTRGLYASLSDESELAGVLAHEIAHVIKRHQIDLMRKQMVISEGSRALEKQLAGEDAALVKNLVGNGAEIFARKLDQGAEFDADRMAVVLAARAGYDPYGLPAVLQKLGSVARTDDRVSLLFTTHPHPDARLQRLGAAMGDQLLRYSRPQAGGRLHPLR